jgi:Tfp pilus assembly protein PilF
VAWLTARSPHVVAALLTGWLLVGCITATAPPPVPEALWRDASFAAPSETVQPDDILTASEAMQRFVYRDMAQMVRIHGPRMGLALALQQPGLLRLEYDGALTRTAAQAFDARQGNCLSLVLMTTALARELGLQVYFQEVLTDEVWSRQADMYVASGHVNLTLGRKAMGEWEIHGSARLLTIDFLPAPEIQGQKVRPISEATVLAMFMNNRAAEAVARQDLNLAYTWAKAAIQRDPSFLSAYNTLGVVYLRHGDPVAAEQTLLYLLNLAPGHTQALANLVLALRGQGRDTDADARVAELARVEHVAPFQFFNLGWAALKAGDAATARDWFLRELARDPDYHEFHFALAQAEWRLGHDQAAQRQLALALSTSPTPSTRDLYAAKLDKLRALDAASSRTQ